MGRGGKVFVVGAIELIPASAIVGLLIDTIPTCATVGLLVKANNLHCEYHPPIRGNPGAMKTFQTYKTILIGIAIALVNVAGHGGGTAANSLPC